MIVAALGRKAQTAESCSRVYIAIVLHCVEIFATLSMRWAENSSTPDDRRATIPCDDPPRVLLRPALY